MHGWRLYGSGLMHLFCCESLFMVQCTFKMKLLRFGSSEGCNSCSNKDSFHVQDFCDVNCNWCCILYV